MPGAPRGAAAAGRTGSGTPHLAPPGAHVAGSCSGCSDGMVGLTPGCLPGQSPSREGWGTAGSMPQLSGSPVCPELGHCGLGGSVAERLACREVHGVAGPEATWPDLPWSLGTRAWPTPRRSPWFSPNPASTATRLGPGPPLAPAPCRHGAGGNASGTTMGHWLWTWAARRGTSRTSYRRPRTSPPPTAVAADLWGNGLRLGCWLQM